MENSTHIGQSILYGTDREINLNLQWMSAHSIHLYQGRNSLYVSHFWRKEKLKLVPGWKSRTPSVTKALPKIIQRQDKTVILSFIVWQDKKHWAQNETQEVPSEHKETLFHCKGDQALPQVDQEGCGVGIPRDFQKSPAHSTEQPALDDSTKLCPRISSNSVMAR